jgi:NAD(P)-dependent dehydrogenase (short-subunit alcohol dehydrogenase family)
MTSPTESDAALPDAADVAACLRVLRLLARQPGLCDRDGLAEVRDHAAGLLRACKGLRAAEVRQRDRDLLDSAGIRGRSSEPSRTESAARLAAPTGPLLLAQPRCCYVCKRSYDRLHPFYDCLCPACGDLNWAKRNQSADLSGRVALVTGGRVKIGYHIALKLLRAGASVAVTTRFPHNAAGRYAAEPDFADWSGRLQIHTVDLRDLPAVDRFGVGLAASLSRLDVLVNNAAQTVRRPPAFYRHLLEQETNESLLPAARALLAGPLQADTLSTRLAALPSLPGEDSRELAYFPPGLFDRDGQQVDLRPNNSWAQELAEVSPLELLEVHAVNCLAPFLLLRRLGPLLFTGPPGPRHVVNVSAMEGQFNGSFKTGRHPHTNMAKAALNMITRTCAAAYAECGVYLNSVDTGWITNEAPQPVAARMAAEGFREPLDVVDGAARVLDPVFVGFSTGQHESGQFWKDYHPIPW